MSLPFSLSSRLVGGMLALVLSTFMLTATQALAQMKAVKEGKVATLDSDEGFLLLAVDSNVALSSIRLNRDGRMLAAGALQRVDEGRSFRLYVVPSGRYQWREVDLPYNARFVLKDDPEFSFEVHPGLVTYPGDLLYRQHDLLRANVSIHNRGLLALDWL